MVGEIKLSYYQPLIASCVGGDIAHIICHQLLHHIVDNVFKLSQWMILPAIYERY